MFFLVFIDFELVISIFRISTQNEVVRDVNALSALLYAAAIRPNIKVIPKNSPSPDLNAICGNKRSVRGVLSTNGTVILFLLAYIKRSAPNTIKRNVTIVN